MWGRAVGDEFWASLTLNRYVAALSVDDEPTATECERLLLEMGFGRETLSEFRNRDWSVLDVFTDEERATILGAMSDALH